MTRSGPTDARAGQDLSPTPEAPTNDRQHVNQHATGLTSSPPNPSTDARSDSPAVAPVARPTDDATDPPAAEPADSPTDTSVGEHASAPTDEPEGRPAGQT